MIPLEYLSEVTTHSLMERRETLIDAVNSFKTPSLKGEKRSRALEELNYVETVLANRMFSARLTETQAGASVFISHSSRDQQFARWIAVDLKNAGHRVWFDEWEILPGGSIVGKMEEGWSGFCREALAAAISPKMVWTCSS